MSVNQVSRKVKRKSAAKKNRIIRGESVVFETRAKIAETQKLVPITLYISERGYKYFKWLAGENITAEEYIIDRLNSANLSIGEELEDSLSYAFDEKAPANTTHPEDYGWMLARSTKDGKIPRLEEN